MSKSTRNSGQPWTPQQHYELMNLASINTPTRVIGLKLGRTEDAVRTKENGNNGFKIELIMEGK
jgi:hypothetical protein